MKNLLRIILLFNLTAYSQNISDKTRVFKSYISEGDRYIPNKIDEAIKSYKKARNWAIQWDMANTYVDLARNKINNAENDLNSLNERIALGEIKSNDMIFPRKKPTIPKTKVLSKIEKKYNSLLEEAKTIYSDYAKLLLENNKFTEAEKLYSKILKFEPDNTDAKYSLFRLEYKEELAKTEKLVTTENSIYQLLLYLNFSLEKKEPELAKRITQKILSVEDNPITRDAISNSYYKNTGDSHFKELFLSDNSKIAEYRDYYIYIKAIPGNKNIDFLEYYTNLVSLDLGYLKTNPVDIYLAKEQTSEHYNNFGWFSLLCQKYDNTLEYFNKSIEYRNDNKTAEGNIPHAYLFTNQFEKAKELYLKLKDLQFDSFSEYKTFKEAFLGDFKDFRKAGIINNDMDKIQALLEE